MRFSARSATLALILFPASLAPLLANQSRTPPGGSPDVQFQRAVTDYNSGQYSAAASELERLAQRVPPTFEVEEMLGLVYSAESKDREARSHFEKAVRLNPNSAAAMANLAVNLARLGEKGLAEAEFKKALQAEPGNFNANHDFGEFYARAGKAKQAIPFLESAQRADPASYGNRYDLSLAYEQAGMWMEAREQIQALLKSTDTAELHSLLGKTDEASGDYLGAANEYQTAARMNPSEPNLYSWGSELLLHQTLDPAIAVFTEGVKRYPNSARLDVGLGLALYWHGSYDDAVKALVKATDVDPSDPRPYYFLSKAYARSQGQSKAVVERFRRFAQLRPQDGRARYYYAMSLWQGKQTGTSISYRTQVEQLLKQSIQLDPSFPDSSLELANVYSAEGKYAEAVPEYRRAIGLDPNLPDAHYRLGQAYVHLGEKNRAQNEFRIHDKLYQQHLAKWDTEQDEVRKFIYATKNPHDNHR